MGKLVLEGGGRKRLRAPDKRSWTAEKVDAFLSTLAESCNVKLACQSAGASTRSSLLRTAFLPQ